MLDIVDLSVQGKGGVMLLEEISFPLECGNCIGITGASGAGKTTLIKSIMGLLDKTCSIPKGKIFLDGENLLELNIIQRRNLCGTVIGFIPQNPMTAFDSHIKIGKLMSETFQVRLEISALEAKQLSEETLKKVNLIDVTRIMHSYSNQLSGGMLQRITMAILWGLKPRYILADEPTSALDEENRNMLIDLFRNYPEKVGILFLSHDPEALKMLCKEIIVLENGKIIEKSPTQKLFESPQSAWTQKFVSYANSSEGGHWKWETSKCRM